MELFLIINAGSSSIKFQVMSKSTLEATASGLLERIYIDGAYSIQYKGEKHEGKADFPNHEKAVEFLVETLKKIGAIQDVADIKGVGHRIVHGGIKYREATVVSEKVIKEIEALIPLAPLHNPGAVAGIRGFQKVAPHAVNLAHFDTAFHTSMPAESYTYAVPKEWQTKMHVRRYGFHGISYDFITEKMESVLGKSKPNLIISHLGNGASICAVKEGKSLNTSMGFTPLAGLIMGTRSGDVAPGALDYLAEQLKCDAKQVVHLLNKESGLKGLTGYADMREIEAQAAKGNADCKLAFHMWAQRVATYIVSYYNQLEGKLDAIIFTAGIGENSSNGRKSIIEQIHVMGLKIDNQKNQSKYESELLISDQSSKFPIYAVRTNEELMIAKKLTAAINK